MFSFQFSPQPPKDYKQKMPLVMNLGLKYQTKKTHFKRDYIPQGVLSEF